MPDDPSTKPEPGSLESDTCECREPKEVGQSLCPRCDEKEFQPEEHQMPSEAEETIEEARDRLIPDKGE